MNISWIFGIVWNDIHRPSHVAYSSLSQFLPVMLYIPVSTSFIHFQFIFMIYVYIYISSSFYPVFYIFQFILIYIYIYRTGTVSSQFIDLVKNHVEYVESTRLQRCDSSINIPYIIVSSCIWFTIVHVLTPTITGLALSTRTRSCDSPHEKFP